MRFFFSYSRQNNDEYLQGFFKELNETILERVGNKDGGGFLDQVGLEVGDKWEPKLEHALREARVFVAAVTAGYVQSAFCGKEWGAFQSRVVQYAASKKGETPPLILPLLWVPAAVPYPDVVKALQYTHGDPKQIVSTKGLKHLCRLKGNYPVEYTNYLDMLAERIISLSTEHAEIDNVTDLPALSKVTSPFEPNSPPAGQGAPVNRRPLGSSGGAKQVHFVFSVANPDDVRQVGRQVMDPYGADANEWHPFYPETRPIGRIAAQTAAADHVALWPREMAFTADLPEAIRQAEERRELVVLFVDRWTALVNRYSDTLRNFDTQSYDNCSVFIPMNVQDPDYTANDGRIKSALDQVLRRRMGSRNDLYFRGDIDSEEALREQLADVLVRLQSEVIKGTTPPTGSVPAGPGRPTLSGPGG